MSDAIDPALLDRARKAWPECQYIQLDAEHDCADDTACEMHAAIARALEEYGKEVLRRRIDEEIEFVYGDPQALIDMESE